ncbi:excalibur calcium-binding domain-containing protein [Streptomyces sp. Tu 3180]|uniref:excalibur calcium-binding domain-containing protein n=1 Tax=Streptomyces sp. Tu 3180 TaxID=2682611 RepID=UPI001FB8589A|nr:excalibur calcium-binding domain-containing protein [Streptomyces sp. Tu 3180]
MTAPASGSGGGYSSGNDDGGGRVSYQNCDAARAAGAAPVHRGEPGYGSLLDRDGDGTGCDS